MEKKISDILIVDDTPENLQVLNSILKIKGYKIRPVTSGKAALQLIEKNPPDLILLDITMPEMSGFELCEILKNDLVYKEIPIIFISALSETSDKIKAFQIGGVDYITKPFHADEVISRIETHLKISMLQNQLMMHVHNLEELVEEQVKHISDHQLKTILSLAKLTQSRDDDTGRHLDRVSGYCRALASNMKRNSIYKEQISDIFIKNFEQASRLHDIGKVGIPDAILLKPGPERLTPEEFEVMKTHTTIGAEALEKIRSNNMYYDLYDMSYDIAYYHHEKWDGSGYPAGLKSMKIPLAARIMSVVDVYDALKSKRCYKPAYSHDKVLQIIREGASTHFDPVVVDSFIQINEEFDDIWNNNQI